MSSKHDLRDLPEPEELRAMIEAARANVPSSAEMAAGEARLKAAIASGAATMPATSLISPASMGAAAILIAAGIVGLWLYARHATPDPVASPPVTEWPKPSLGQRPDLDREPNQEPVSDAVVEVPPGRTSTRTMLRAPRKELNETELLTEAQKQLLAMPSRALLLVDEHERRFSTSVLAEEREIIAIQAIEKLRRLSDLKERTRLFVERFPNSSYRRRAERFASETATTSEGRTP